MNILKKYRYVRQQSLKMASPLCDEQCRIQPSIEVSPPWWNLAHTSWFFVRNILEPNGAPITAQDKELDYILNSYYVSLGSRLDRDKRGLMTRPRMKEVLAYRKSVDKRMEALIRSKPSIAPLIHLGLQHEQQHQELFYTEIKSILFQNPPALRETYAPLKKTKSKKPLKSAFLSIPEGLYEFGNLEDTWGWDNEYPVHKYYLPAFKIQNRLVTNREYLQFIRAGGYKKQLLWLNNGWTAVQTHQWEAPLYWDLKTMTCFTLHGNQPINLDEPVSHVSFYEAEAYARWKKARLPTEREWELACRLFPNENPNFLTLHPKASSSHQFLGDVWEWTASYFEPYPGYSPYSGPLREYNEKFMDNQRVLRGGSCVSEPEHIRASYRNFFVPETRFQFSGFRLAL